MARLVLQCKYFLSADKICTLVIDLTYRKGHHAIEWIAEVTTINKRYMSMLGDLYSDKAGFV